jgi:hypothetical protein
MPLGAYASVGVTFFGALERVELESFKEEELDMERVTGAGRLCGEADTDTGYVDCRGEGRVEDDVVPNDDQKIDDVDALSTGKLNGVSSFENGVTNEVDGDCGACSSTALFCVSLRSGGVDEELLLMLMLLLPLLLLILLLLLLLLILLLLLLLLLLILLLLLLLLLLVLLLEKSPPVCSNGEGGEDMGEAEENDIELGIVGGAKGGGVSCTSGTISCMGVSSAFSSSAGKAPDIS